MCETDHLIRLAKRTILKMNDIVMSLISTFEKLHSDLKVVAVMFDGKEFLIQYDRRDNKNRRTLSDPFYITNKKDKTFYQWTPMSDPERWKQFNKHIICKRK